jgi:hypothetical protein
MPLSRGWNDMNAASTPYERGGRLVSAVTGVGWERRNITVVAVLDVLA